MNTHETIVENLKGRVYGVNMAVAVSGAGPEGFTALREMICDGLVREKTVRVPNGPTLSLYSLRPLLPTSIRLVVDE